MLSQKEMNEKAIKCSSSFLFPSEWMTSFQENSFQTALVVFTVTLNTTPSPYYIPL